MPKSLFEDVKICISVLTRFPVSTSLSTLPEDGEDRLKRIGKAYRAAPVVGLIAGVVGAFAYLVGSSMTGSPVYLAAVMAVGAQLLITGGSQEIGFSKVISLRPHPSADQNGHDESAGVAAGTLATMIMMLLKIFLIGELATPWAAGMGLIASAALGRAAQVQLMAFSSDNSSAQPSKVDATTSMVVGAAIGGVALLFASGLQFYLPVIGAVIGIAISTLVFFGFTKSRHHLDNLNVKEALSLVVEIGALYGIVELMPVGFN